MPRAALLRQVVADPAIPGLYGLTQSNRRGRDLWGKNQFNSTFPAALACYMRDHGHPVVYLRVDPTTLGVVSEEVSCDRIFNTDLPNSEIYFAFESVYEPYRRFAVGADLGGIDLVLQHRNGPDVEYLRALEVKLTALPDSTTWHEQESEWGSELVIRPATTSYCAIGMYASCQEHRERIRELFRPFDAITNWGVAHTVYHHLPHFIAALDTFQRDFAEAHQQPFLLQPIWKTNGQRPDLADNAFDIFVWSDFALFRPIIDKARYEEPTVGEDMARSVRSVARLTRALRDLSLAQALNVHSIYQEGAGAQNDKEIALPGRTTRDYMLSARRGTPKLPKSVVRDILGAAGLDLLKPERRLDASLYFTLRDG